MVRARGVARKSFARRRVRRVKKYNCHVTPLRYKKYLPRMSDLIEPKLADSVGLEPFIDAELTLKGVPTSEFPYYYGFAKRMLALYRNFTGETLKKEKESLIEEYVLRGKVRHVLEQEQDVVEEYVGIVVSCDQVKACLEGNYTSYSCLWKQTYAVGESDGNILLGCYENIDKIFIENQYSVAITERTLSDGSSPTVNSNILSTLLGGQISKLHSLLRKYFCYVVNEGGVPKAKIYKDGALLQTFDLSLAPISWATTGRKYFVSVSPDGKYILIDNINSSEYALLQGS